MCLLEDGVIPGTLLVRSADGAGELLRGCLHISTGLKGKQSAYFYVNPSETGFSAVLQVVSQDEKITYDEAALVCRAVAHGFTMELSDKDVPPPRIELGLEV